MKAIKQAQTRNILDAYNKENISYSRMNEMFNELANDWAIEFAQFITGITHKQVEGYFYFYYYSEWKTTKELLEIFKKEKGL